MSYKIIIARYNECLKWINKMNIDNIVIYNKGNDYVENAIQKKNIGREVESFFHYIVNNYYDLPDYLIFVQGNPFDHMKNINEDNFQDEIDKLINSGISDIMPLFTNIYNETHRKFPFILSYEYYSYFFEGDIPQESSFASGCQYIIPKQNILSRPIQFYMKIHAMTLNTNILTSHDSHYEYKEMDVNSIDGWCIERLMYFFFCKQIPISNIMKQKRYLITGGSGFIGSTLVNTLSNDHNIVVIDNLTTGDIKYIQMNNNIHFIEGNILDNDKLYLVGYVDGIFHLAAMSKVFPSLESKDMVNFCVEQNVLGTINILKYASSFNKPMKVIYSASSTYYGMNAIPNIETQISDCQTPYALSKYCGEMFCELFYKLYNVPSVRLRYFMVYGPNEPSTGSYAIVTGIFLKRKHNNLPLLIHGDGSQTRDFVHVDDICKANILAMNNPELLNETINVGTGEMVSIKDLANMISLNQMHIESRKIDLKNTLCDTAKLKEKLNWIPNKKIEDYIKLQV
jgi:nucleoside-diphosphate-sugar epimerase